MSKFFITLGIIFILIGLIINIAPKIPFLGRLPGDIFIKKENFVFFFPITTSIILSIILSILLNLFKK